jgi:hypothetical protein
VGIGGRDDVGGFDVAVDDPLGVRVVERVGRMRDDADDVGEGEWSTAVEVTAVEISHGEPGGSVLDTEVVNGDDARVIEGCRGACLIGETVQECRVSGTGRDDLECLTTTQMRILDEVDLTHSTGAKWADHAVARENRARFEQRHSSIPPTSSTSLRILAKRTVMGNARSALM